MPDTLIRIKRLILAKHYRFSRKAQLELIRDRVSEEDVAEAIINAPAIYKRVVSHDPANGMREYLYIISGPTYSGLIIYTKGKFLHEAENEEFYFLISSKRDVNL